MKKLSTQTSQVRTSEDDTTGFKACCCDNVTTNSRRPKGKAKGGSKTDKKKYGTHTRTIFPSGMAGLADDRVSYCLCTEFVESHSFVLFIDFRLSLSMFPSRGAIGDRWKQGRVPRTNLLPVSQAVARFHSTLLLNILPHAIDLDCHDISCVSSGN